MLYLHIPYCKQICPYCDFYRTANRRSQDDFVKALCQEIKLKSLNSRHLGSIETVYWGGGTPSLLTQQEFSCIMGTLEEYYDLSLLKEHTLEADPATFDKDLALLWKEWGVNRISLGMQSFVDDELEILGRGHCEKDIYEAWDILQQVGFSNISMDVVTCFPRQKKKGLQHTLEQVVALQVPHVSVYALDIALNSVWGKWLKYRPERLVWPDDVAGEEMLALVGMLLGQADYKRYEIASYACDNRWESRHNWGYWLGKPYWGFGPSAHSFDGDSLRSYNPPKLATYLVALQNNSLPLQEIDCLDQEQKRLESLLLGLRTCQGVSVASIEPQKLEKLKQEGYVVVDKKVCLTEKGQNVYNMVLEMLVA